MTLSSKLDHRPTRVLGIDANTNNMAFAIFDSLELVHYGKINFGSGEMHDKLRVAGMVSRAFVKKWKVDYIAIEGSVFVQSMQVAIKLAYTNGALISGLSHDGAKVVTVSPKAWQTFIDNKAYTKAMKAEVAKSFPDKGTSWVTTHIRKQRKQYTIDHFNNKFDVAIDDDDVADACGIAWYAANHSIS